jgi:hypothetical protein
MRGKRNGIWLISLRSWCFEDVDPASDVESDEEVLVS